MAGIKLEYRTPQGQLGRSTGAGKIAGFLSAEDIGDIARRAVDAGILDPNSIMSRVVTGARVPMSPQGACGCAPSYGGVGHVGPANLAAEGVGVFGAGLWAGAQTTSETQKTGSPKRPIRGRQVIAGGTSLANWKVSTFKINEDSYLHGDDAPASIFAQNAAHPVPFDVMIGTQDVVTIGTKMIVADLPTTSAGLLSLAFLSCYRGDQKNFPCAPIAPGSRQIILGMGDESGNGTTTAGTPTTGTDLNQAPKVDIRLGRLVLDGVYTAIAGGVTPRQGETAINGQRVLEFCDITQIDINDVDILTTVGTNGGISAQLFAAEAVSPFFANTLVNTAQTINIKWRNYSYDSTSAEAAITLCGAWVGCEQVLKG